MKGIKAFMLLLATLVFSLSITFSTGHTSELTFKFTIPSLGGDPLYSTYYLQQAQLQNEFKERSKPLFKPKSLIERFTESLTSQLLYRMADTILDQIFGDDGSLRTGEYTIGNFKIGLSEEQRNGTYYYIFRILDISTNQETILELPKFI